ncbi:Pyridoxal-phosphate dependent enzyme [Aspergillus sp. HF37]|nr:Pyridoxal-phosphate dependent enzyme [Aspergillus sp. HF37]
MQDSDNNTDSSCFSPPPSSSSSSSDLHDRIAQILTGPPQTIYFRDVHQIVTLLREACEPFHNTLSQVPVREMDISTRRFGDFGGRYAPELQMEALSELGNQFRDAICDPDFWRQFVGCGFVDKTPLTLATKLTEHGGGANIWLKREDTNLYASHKIRNIVGQVLLAKRMGKSEIIIDCGFAGHGLVCASLCQKLGLKCTVFMGIFDGEAQEKDVFAMRQRGASVLFSENGLGCYTVRAALDDAHRHAISNFEDGFYIASGPIGPHPLPLIHRFFQSLLGEETKDQCVEAIGSAPDAVVAPVGMGSGAVGMFTPFIDAPDVRLVGVQPARAAPLTSGSVGVLYGACTYLLQDDNGQILDSHSYAEDLASPTVGPELAHWKDDTKAEFVEAADTEATDGMTRMRVLEDFTPSFATAYAVDKTLKVARELGQGKNVVLLVAGEFNPLVEVV